VTAVFGYASIFISTVAYVIYCHDIMRGKTKPHAFSWLIWSVLGLTVYVIQLAEGAGPGAWTNGYAGLACAVIFCLTIKFGDRKVVWIDWIFLLAAGLAYLSWLVTKQALPSILLLTVIDFFGFLPTYRKSYSRPFEESASMYWISATKYLVSLFAFTTPSLVNLLYPVVLVLLNSVFTVMLYIRRYQLTKPS